MYADGGGEEFVLIIENVDKEKLYKIANKLKALVEKSVIFGENNGINVTISIGATMAKENDTINTLIMRADELMYQSKRSGKNLVSIN